MRARSRLNEGRGGQARLLAVARGLRPSSGRLAADEDRAVAVDGVEDRLEAGIEAGGFSGLDGVRLRDPAQRLLAEQRAAGGQEPGELRRDRSLEEAGDHDRVEGAAEG